MESLRWAALCWVLVLAACSESRTPAVYGAPCGPGTPCGGDLLCVSAATFPGGYCSIDCTTATCGSGAICDRDLAPPLCLATCTSHDDCRDGYQCWRGACRAGCDVDPSTCGSGASCGADGRCVGPECTTDPECGAGRRCASGRCVDLPADGGVLGEDGAPCGSDADCRTGICLPPERGGVCSSTCSAPTECIVAVTFPAVCAPVSRAGAIETLCVPFDAGAEVGSRCTTDADCESATCASGQCTQTCVDAEDCLVGQICGDVAWGGGTFTGCGFAPGSGNLEIDLGTHDLMAGYGSSTLTFATPPGSVSVTLRAQVVGGDPLPISFYDVIDPTGATIFDLGEIYEWRDPPIRWLPLDADEAIGMLVPNTTTDRLTYYPGRHDVRVLAMTRSMTDMGHAMVHVTALVKRGTGTVSSGTLDLDVFLVGVGVTASAAPTNSRVQAALGRFGTLMSRAGISVGDVQYVDVSSADATTYQVIDTTDGPTSELAGLFRLSAGRTGRLSIFLVRSVNGGGSGFNTLGIAGGIPGPSWIPGTSHSGVVVAFDGSVVGSSGALAGHVMAHEVSHFLGLYHTTEQGRPCGPGEDPSTVACAPFGGTDTIGDTTRGDDTNLMNWSLVGSGSNDRLTTGQSFVLLRSSLVR